jgi:hypothetical protein
VGRGIFAAERNWQGKDASHCTDGHRDVKESTHVESSGPAIGANIYSQRICAHQHILTRRRKRIPYNWRPTSKNGQPMEFPETPTLTPANWGHAVTLSDRPDAKLPHRHAVTAPGRPDVTPSHQQAVTASRLFGSGSSGRITDTVTQNRNNPFRDYTATTIESSRYGATHTAR